MQAPPIRSRLPALKGYRFRPKPLFLYLVGRRIAFYFCLTGFAFDSAKALLYTEWRPYQLYGPSILLLYAACNLAVPVLFACFSWAGLGLARRRLFFRSNHERIHISLGLSVLFSGFLNWMFLLLARNSERTLIPLVFHGGFAFLAIIALSSTAVARDQLLKWSRASRIIAKTGQEIRQEFAAQNQELTRNVIQAMKLWSFMVAVAMTILFVVKSRNGWNPTDPDLIATGVQFLVGLLTGCCGLWFWGLKPAEYTRQRAGAINLHAPGQSATQVPESTNYLARTIFIIQHVHGGVFYGPVAAKMEHCTSIVAQPVDDVRKHFLEQLMTQVTDLIARLPEHKREDAAEHLQALVDSVLSEEPNRPRYEASSQALLDVSQSVTEFKGNLMSAVDQLRNHLWPGFRQSSAEEQRT